MNKSREREPVVERRHCNAASRPKLLIIERKLISNRGHQHTQISALKSLLADHDVSFIAGESYDGFLGEAAGKLSDETAKLARLRSRLVHGTLSQRFKALLGTVRAGRISLPASAYGQTLVEVSRRIGLGPEDLVVIPTAELESLESAREMYRHLGIDAPRVCLRFLSPDLGEIKERLREPRFRAALAGLPDRIALFTETEELAGFLREEYGANVTGGFFLPCSVQISISPRSVRTDGGTFRVGVFGAPRREKGNSRIELIIRELVRLRKPSSDRQIEFVVQGSDHDFSPSGIYHGLMEYAEGKDGVTVSPYGDRLSPGEFETLFGSVDAILLPYDVSLYGLQGSGVIQDAVAAHKPIIYTAGMSMASFLCHGNACAASSDREFADATLQMAADPAYYEQGAIRAAAHFSEMLQTSPLIQAVHS